MSAGLDQQTVFQSEHENHFSEHLEPFKRPKIFLRAATLCRTVGQAVSANLLDFAGFTPLSGGGVYGSSVLGLIKDLWKG